VTAEQTGQARTHSAAVIHKDRLEPVSVLKVSKLESKILPWVTLHYGAKHTCNTHVGGT
jgi:hypothetical protein